MRAKFVEIMTRNKFAIECMTRVNEFAETQGASHVKTTNFDEDGNQLFFHEDGDEDFGPEEMIEWFNITFHDPDNINDGMITPEMVKTEAKGRELCFITDKTPTTW